MGRGKGPVTTPLVLVVLTFAFVAPLQAGEKCRDLTATCRAEQPGERRDYFTLNDFYGKSYAVVVGVNRYPRANGRVQDLEFARADAESVAGRLQQMGFEVKLLVDEAATRDGILGALEDIASRAQKRDRVMFYFAGHGDTREGFENKYQGFILPSDYEPQKHRATAISMEDLKGISDGIKANHMLYAMDSCFSGSLVRSRSGLGGQLNPNLYEHIKKLTEERAHVVITAGGKDQKVKEVDGHGVFTKTLLDALSEEHLDRKPWVADGYLTSMELASYIKKRITEVDARQNPQYGFLSGEGDVVLALYKPTEPPRTTAPPAAMNQDDVQRRIKEAEDRARREAEERARQEAALKEENLRRQLEQERLQRERTEQDRIRREQDLARREAEARDREREQARRAQEERDRLARERARAAERERQKSRSNEDVFVPPSF